MKAIPVHGSSFSIQLLKRIDMFELKERMWHGKQQARIFGLSHALRYVSLFSPCTAMLPRESDLRRRDKLVEVIHRVLSDEARSSSRACVNDCIVR